MQDLYEIWFLAKQTEHTLWWIELRLLFCTSLASSVKSCTLTTSILVHSIDHFQALLHHVLWTFLQFLLCVVAKKCWKPYLFWHQFAFAHIKGEALIYVIYVPHIVFIQTIKCRETSENWAFMSYSLDVGSYFTFKILHEEKLHFLVSFSFKKQFEVHQNDPEHVFEGDTFA